MIKFLKELFSSENKRIKELETQVVTLQEKLQQRQEHIDKTNAYWKKKLYNIQNRSLSRKV